MTSGSTFAAEKLWNLHARVGNALFGRQAFDIIVYTCGARKGMRLSEYEDQDLDLQHRRTTTRAHTNYSFSQYDKK